MGQDSRGRMGNVPAACARYVCGTHGNAITAPWNLMSGALNLVVVFCGRAWRHACRSFISGRRHGADGGNVVCD